MPWTIAPGMTIRRSIRSLRAAAKAPFWGLFWAWLAMIGKANVGPKTTIAPMTWRNRNRARSGDNERPPGLAGSGDSGS